MFEKTRNYIKENWINLLIILLYSGITLASVLMHEAWRDEAQAWLIARDLSPWEILKQMKYEGHPALWHFILMPFAKLGFPYITINIISWALMVASSYLILNKSPFNIVIKIAILISAPFIYYFPVIARSYSLITFLITLLATVYPNRAKYKMLYAILIILLANTHVIISAFAGAVALMFVIEELWTKRSQNTKVEKKKNYQILTILILGFLVFVLQVVQSIGASAEVETVSLNGASLINKIINMIYYAFQSDMEMVTFLTIFYTVLLTGFVLFRYIKKQFSVFLISFGFQIFVYTYVYHNMKNPQMFFTAFLIVMFCSWAYYYDEKYIDKKYSIKVSSSIIIISQIILLLLSIGTIKKGFEATQYDWKNQYSEAKVTSEYIKNNIESNSLIFAAPDYTTESILPYTSEYKFINPSLERESSFVTWNEGRKKIPNYNKLKDIIEREENYGKKVYFIVSPQSLMSGIIDYMVQNGEIQEIYRSEGGNSDEKYIIYNYNNG